MTDLDEYRAAALEHANQARSEMFELRSRIRAGGRHQGPRIAADAALEGSSRMRFRQLVRAVPGVGRIRTNQLLAAAEINPEERVNSPMVTRRKRKLLADELVGPTIDGNGRAA